VSGIGREAHDGQGGAQGSLDAAALRRLRRAVAAARAQPSPHGRIRAVPDLLTLTGLIPEGAGITIDFQAAEELGQPLVVLRLPPEPAGARLPTQAASAPGVPAPAVPAPAAPARTDPPFLARLTPREREVAALVGQGLRNKEIAARLHITLGTVKDHVHRILAKAELSGRPALIAALAGPPPAHQ
jgi:DNA-binding CsgD family transcriptional regulator